MIKHGDASLALSKKIAAVVSEKIEVGTAMNAVAHMALGLGTVLGPDEALMCDYRDANGVSHQSISAYPFIVLKGRPNKIREAVDLAKEKGVQVIDFVNTMTVGTYAEQLERTSATQADQLDFYGAVFFGDAVIVSELTRKFSLYK